MAELRLIEHYISVQGEGPKTGIMTQFVRFAGCNMRCPLWPCDTQHAIEPSIYMKAGNSYKQSPGELAQACLDKALATGAWNLCLTGGEPFLQPNDKLEEFLTALHPNFSIECFSNGSFIYPQWAINYISFIMDWKLMGSGEGETQLANRHANSLQLNGDSAIKFVVASNDDLNEAKEVYERLTSLGAHAEFYVGAVWSKISDQEVIDYVLFHKLPWKLNIQVHKYIWDPEKQGV